MPDDEPDYKLARPRQAAAAHPFRKGQSGNPDGRSEKNRPALLADALNEPVFVTINGRRQKITSARRSWSFINWQQVHQRRFARAQDAASMYSSTKQACWEINLPFLETDAHGFDRALTHRSDVEWGRAT